MKLWDNILNLDLKKQLLFVSLFILIVFLDAAFILKTQFDGINKNGPKISKLKDNLDTLTKELAMMQDLKNKQVATNQKLLLNAKTIISQEALPSLVEDISGLANNNNIRISQIKPVKEVVAKKKNAISERFTGILINLEVSCDYHNLGKFINDLENSKIFIAVQNMKVKPSQGNPLSQNVTLVLKTYVKK